MYHLFGIESMEVENHHLFTLNGDPKSMPGHPRNLDDFRECIDEVRHLTGPRISSYNSFRVDGAISKRWLTWTHIHKASVGGFVPSILKPLYRSNCLSYIAPPSKGRDYDFRRIF